jgi:signal-transduction protein with cAMP-binding, CBS, and nucleotidyltransferase domain
MTDVLDTHVGTVMTSPVRTVDRSTSAAAVASVLIEEAVGSVIVRDPPGIVTKTDLVAAIHRGDDLTATTAEALMTRSVVTVAPEADLQTALDRMADHGIKRLVVEADGTFVGIVTTTDVASAFAIDLDAVIGAFAGSG